MKSPWNPVMTTFPISVLLLENIRDILHLNTGIRYDSKRNNRLFSTGLPLIKSRFLYFLIFLNNISLSNAVPLGFHNRNHLIHIVLTGLHVSCLYHNADQRLCS